LDLSIIIVNYNVKEFLQNLLASLFKAITNLSTEIIVVDNGSDDGSIEMLREKFPKVTLISSKINLGFSKANNLGLKIAKGKYLLLLNPDTIVQEDTFEKLIQFFNDTKDAGMVGCKILNPDGTLQLACRRSFPGPWTSFCKVSGLSSLFPKSKLFARYNLTFMDENRSYEVDAISGSFMMLRRILIGATACKNRDGKFITSIILRSFITKVKAQNGAVLTKRKFFTTRCIFLLRSISLRLYWLKSSLEVQLFSGSCWHFSVSKN